jgi:hypothetical protein
MSKISLTLVAVVVVVAAVLTPSLCVRQSPEMVRKRAIRDEIKQIRTVIEHQESRR